MTRWRTHSLCEQVSKNAANLPPGAEADVNKKIDDMLMDFPIEEMLQAMIPVYQKHWTGADVDAMVAFYSTPRGQKILKDLPAATAEAMQAAMPIIQKRMEAMTERVQQEVAQMTKDSKTKPAGNSQARPN